MVGLLVILLNVAELATCVAAALAWRRLARPGGRDIPAADGGGSPELLRSLGAERRLVSRAAFWTMLAMSTQAAAVLALLLAAVTG